MNDLFNSNLLLPLFIRGRSFLIALALVLGILPASTVWAGFTVWPPSAEQPLDGQTTDWINITSNALGAGVGTLYGGTVNVGIEGLTWSGDLFINNGGLLDANQVDGNNLQYSGTINVGPRLEMVNGGHLILNGDALNVLGYEGLDRDNTERVIDGTFNVFTGSEVTADASTILGASRIRVDGAGSSLTLNPLSTLGFHDELWVSNGAELSVVGSTLGFDNSVGRSTHARGDIIILGDSLVEVIDSTIDTTGGTGGELKVEDSSLIATRAQLNLGGRLLVKGTGLLDATDGTINSGSLTVENGGTAYLENEIVNTTGDISVTDGSSLDLTDTDVTTGSNGWMKVLGASQLLASRNSQLEIGGTLQIQDGSQMDVTDNSSVGAENLYVEHAGSQLQMAGGELNVRNKISIGNIGDPNGTLDLDGTTVTAGEISVLGTLTANGSTIAAGSSFSGYGQDGTAAAVALTDSSLRANWIGFDQSTHTYTNSNVIATDSIEYKASTVNQTGGTLTFADEMFVRDGTVMSVQGTLAEHARVSHQDSDSDDNNRGSIVLDNASLSLTAADVDLSTGGAGEILIHNGSQLTADDSQLNNKAMILENDSQATLTDSTVDTGAMRVLADSTLTLDNSVVTTGGSEWMSLLGNSRLMASRDSQLQVGGVLQIQEGSQAHLTDSRVAAESLYIEHADSQLQMTGGELNVSNKISIGNIDDPNGTLALDGTTVTTNDISVLGTLNAIGSTIDAGTRIEGHGQSGSGANVTLTDSSLQANWIGQNRSTHTYTDSNVVSTDSIEYKASTVNQTGGTLTFADEMFVRDGTVMSVQGTLAEHARVSHQDSDSDDDNRGSIVLDNASLSLTAADVDLSTGGAGEILIHNGSQLTADDSQMKSKAMILENDSHATLTDSTVETGAMRVLADSTLTLDNSVVATGGGESMSLLGNSRLMASRTSQLQVGGVLQIQQGSQAQLTDSSVGAEDLYLEHADSQLKMTGGELNVSNKISIGNIGDPNGTLDLDGTTVTANEMSVLGTLKANDSSITASGSFSGYGQDGTAAAVALTDSSLQANWIGFDQSTQTYINSNVVSTDSIEYKASTVSQTGGTLTFADQLFLLDGTAMTVQGTATERAVVRHQSDADEPDNRGDLSVDNSILSLAYADVNISSGDIGLLRVHNSGQLTAADSNLVSKRVVAESGGQVELTRGSLTADSLTVASGSFFSETDAIVNILGNTTTIAEGGSMVLNGGIFMEAGDFIVNGSLTGTAPDIDVGFDFILGDTGSVNFSGPTEMLVGDDFILSALASLGDLSQLSLHMLGSNDDEGNGSVFDSAAALGRLIVETSLTLMGDLVVDNLVIGSGFGINLNNHSLTIIDSFIGEYAWISGGDVFGPEPGTAPVPEPSTLLLLGGGLLGVAWWRRKK